MVPLSDPLPKFQDYGFIIDAIDVMCVQLTRDLFAIAKSMLSYLTLNIIVTLKSRLEVTQCHSYWYRSKAWVVSYSHFIVTMAVSLVVCEIFSVHELRDLENWVRGRSR